MASVTAFGAELLRTGDLDPVYVALYRAALPRDTLNRVCLAYWCFYHLGLAAYIAEQGTTPRKFWELMMRAAINEGDPKPFPRGSERRYYRGAQAVMSMTSMMHLYPKGATQAVEAMVGPPGLSTRYSQVSARVQLHRGFGEWIAFKIADMSERVLGYNVDFSDCHLGIYKDPRQGAAVACLEYRYPGSLKPDGINQFADCPWFYPITDNELKETVEHYIRVFRKMKLKAPGGNPRPVNVQEVETIFCKYKSHLKGHYPMGKDTAEIKHGLDGWGKLALKLLEAMP